MFTVRPIRNGYCLEVTIHLQYVPSLREQCRMMAEEFENVKSRDEFLAKFQEFKEDKTENLHSRYAGSHFRASLDEINELMTEIINECPSDGGFLPSYEYNSKL